MYMMVTKKFKVDIVTDKPVQIDQRMYSDSQNVDISLDHLVLRTEASRTLFSEGSISPLLRSKYLALFTFMSPHKPHKSFQGTTLIILSFSTITVLRIGMIPMAGVEAQKRWCKICCCPMKL